MKYLIYIAILTWYGNCRKAVPPTVTALINEESYPFINNQLTLTATVPEIVSYQQSNNGTDCNAGWQGKQQNWLVGNTSDYIEVTIFLSDGVKPGINNQRSFGLYNVVTGRSTPTVGPISLVMRSGDANPYLLSKITWRFSLDGIDNPLTEVVNTGQSNTTPFPRHLDPNALLGKQWTILVPAGVKPENVNATIRYYLHMGNVYICN